MISKTHQFHPIKIRSRNTFNKTTSTNIRLLMRNEVSNWQYVGFFVLTYKAKPMCWLPYTKLQNKTQYRRGRSFSEVVLLAKKSA